MIKLIWAMDLNWLIGKKNKLPWRYKEDLDYFKETVRGKTVLMGDKTYDSLKGYYKKTPLPFGKMYVACLEERVFDDAIKIEDIDAFLKDYKDELFVIGGATIYKLSLPYADKLYITWILKTYKGDAYFPEFNLVEDFRIESERYGESPDLKFSVYVRK